MGVRGGYSSQSPPDEVYGRRMSHAVYVGVYLRCGVGDAPVADRRRQREGRLGQVLRAVVTYR